MKKHLLILAILLCSITFSKAQESARQSHREEIQSLKIAFMSETLSLTPAESEKFWPIYNKYWGERVKISQQRRSLFMKIEKETATQSEIDELVKLASTETALMSQFATELSKVISADKAAKTFVAEEKFKNNLLRRTQGGGGGK